MSKGGQTGLIIVVFVLVGAVIVVIWWMKKKTTAAAVLAAQQNGNPLPVTHMLGLQQPVMISPTQTAAAASQPVHSNLMQQ